MQQYALSEQISDWFAPTLTKARRSYERSSSLHIALLILANVFGCALMLSPVIILASASATGLHMFNNIDGPLDWFLLGVMAAISLFCGLLSIQLYHSRPRTPSGVQIEKKQASLLFSMLERRVVHFGIKPIDHVILTPRAELIIEATPSWPIPFFHKYTLCVGTPSLFFISPGQFRLALAGAFAATTRRQNSVLGWAVQASDDWDSIIKSLESYPTLYASLFLKLANIIAEFTERLSTELRTDLQQIQSRWVLENTDETNANDYLANHVVTSSFLEQHYWPMIFKAAERCPTPVVKPFSHFELILERTLTEDSAKRWLLQAQASRDARHRDLRDLLAVLGIDHLQWSKLPQRNAFHAIFKSNAILKHLDKYWQSMVASEWKQRHSSFRQEKMRFDKLQERAQLQNLRGDSALHYIQLATTFLDKKDAISVYLSMYKGNQDNAGICYASGREMLACGYSQVGYEALQRASELDRSLAIRAQTLINDHKQAWIKQGNDLSNVARTA
ncbi:MAG: hypothetical protein ACN4GR_05605 [Arenicellales bacterium]